MAPITKVNSFLPSDHLLSHNLDFSVFSICFWSNSSYFLYIWNRSITGNIATMHNIHLRESRVERSAETVFFCYLESLKLWKNDEIITSLTTKILLFSKQPIAQVEESLKKSTVWYDTLRKLWQDSSERFLFFWTDGKSIKNGLQKCRINSLSNIPDSSDFEPKDRTWRNPCVIGLRRALSHGGSESSVETCRTKIH